MSGSYFSYVGGGVVKGFSFSMLGYMATASVVEKSTCHALSCILFLSDSNDTLHAPVNMFVMNTFFWAPEI